MKIKSGKLILSSSAWLWLVALCLVCAQTVHAGAGLALHPENPHYFLWRGKPTVLITSGEHYGAVLNLDFDYRKYLRTLAADKLNLTRTWAGGPYVEPQGAFNIAHNTLAPAAGRYITPWARSQEPGYAGGGSKFDLSRWDPAYFKRLNDFMEEADRRGVVVEMNLFCPMYEEARWKLSPFHQQNNVNGLGNVNRTNIYTLDKHGGLLAVQERMVRKLVEELQGYENLYYEICNEPYFGGVTMEWQHHIADIVTEAQRNHRIQKLISQNIANRSAGIENPHPAISIFNFHYATPPEAVGRNYHLNKVIGDNETGFRGTNDFVYRSEAWGFLFAGGGLFNHLDYSFTVGHQDGTFAYPATQPGGGSPAYRKQMRVLKEFLHGMDFIHSMPGNGVLKGNLGTNFIAHAMIESGKGYAVYVRQNFPEKGPVSLVARSATFGLELPTGDYGAEWMDPRNGAKEKMGAFKHTGGVRNFATREFSEDIVLRVMKKR